MFRIWERVRCGWWMHNIGRIWYKRFLVLPFLPHLLKIFRLPKKSRGRVSALDFRIQSSFLISQKDSRRAISATVPRPKSTVMLTPQQLRCYHLNTDLLFWITIKVCGFFFFFSSWIIVGCYIKVYFID